MQRPNLLFLMCDQLRSDVTDPEHPCQTPNIDRLSRRGIRFTRAYTPNAVCSPARASLMTGLLPHNHGVTVVTHNVDDDQSCLRTEKPHWAQRLRQQGYRTGYFGKWHIERSNDLEKFGWDVNGSYESPRIKAIIDRQVKQGPYALAKYNTEPPGYNPDSLLYGVTEADASERMFRVAVDSGMDFIREQAAAAGPWCCFVSLTEPHDPFVCSRQSYAAYDADGIQLPESVDDPLDNRPNIYKLAQRVWKHLTPQERRQAAACYYASVTDIDAEFGRILQLLEEQGQLDSTVIVLTSDHGELLGSHGLYCKNFHAGEEVYNIPLIMAGPGIKTGEVSSARVGSHDLCPTLLEFLDCDTIDVPDSASFAHLLQNPHGTETFQQGFAEFFGGRMNLTQRVVWDGSWKLVFNGFDYSELYDLDSDPSEMHNRIHDPSCDETVKQMFKLMWKNVRDTGDHSLFGAEYPILRIAPYGPRILDE